MDDEVRFGPLVHELTAMDFLERRESQDERLLLKMGKTLLMQYYCILDDNEQKALFKTACLWRETFCGRLHLDGKNLLTSRMLNGVCSGLGCGRDQPRVQAI